MTLESVCDATENANRDGTLALMTPVITFTDGRCVASTRWIPTARAICAMRTTESSTARPATIIRSLSSSTMITMKGKRSNMFPSSLPASHFSPVARDVAHCGVGEELVAALHLGNGPFQCVGGFLRVGDHAGQQMRNAVVLAQLDPLGVDEDQADLLGRRPHQDRRDHGIDAGGLSRPGGAGDDQMRQLVEMQQSRGARDVFSQRDRERVVDCGHLGSDEDVTKGYQLPTPVGDLDTNGALARDGRQDPDVR